MMDPREAASVAEPERPERHRLAEDDLLKGFDQTGPSRGRLGGFFAISIAGSLYVWNVAFTLGAYHTLFYHQRQQLFVAALVVLLGSLIMRPQLQIQPWLLALFTPPLLIVLLRFIFPVNHAIRATYAVRIADRVLLVATLACTPVIIWVIARLLAPTYFTLPGRRAKIAVIAVISVVAVIGFAIGRLNTHFLTCEDFQIAGDDTPKGCFHSRHH
jgi:hypothetical protein